MPTMFDRIQFPEYRYREYPKVIYPPEGPTYEAPDSPDAGRRGEPHLIGKPIGVTVYSEEEEAEVLAANPDEIDEVGLIALRARAEQLCISVDGRWGMVRLKEEIAKAEAH